MVDLCTHVNNTSIVSDLKVTIKRQRLSDQNKKVQTPTIYYVPETYFKYEDTNGLKVEGRKKLQHVNNNHKKAAVAILTSAKQTSEQGMLTGIKRNII